MKPRIALVGNMNNNFFALARHLRDRGYGVRLFFADRSPHFHPTTDSFDARDMEIVQPVDWLERGFYYAPFDQVRQELEGYDFYLGQGDEAAVASRAGFSFRIYFPYGSDVYKYAYLPAQFRWTQRWAARLLPGRRRLPYALMKAGTAAFYLRKAIREAPYLMADYTNEDFESRLRGLDPRGKRLALPLPFIYPPAYEHEDRMIQLPSSVREQILRIREGADFVVLYHGRQEWKTYHNDFTSKNTHHLILGFGDFLRRHPEASPRLVMLEYGSDVEASKQLIAELGIGHAVQWLEKMERRALICLIDQVDLGSGEFGRSYLSFGTIMEAMIRGRAVIHHREDGLYRQYSRLYPMIHARSPEEISSGLSWAYSHRDQVREMGLQAKAWVESEFLERPLAQIESCLRDPLARRI